MALREYSRKRHFGRTAEPKARVLKRSRNRFVVQKHAASRLHYDFRLELDGVLKSWAVPKGVPYAKGEKRLAVEVEDHPVGYLKFEGVIPKGEYGGGTVMVWDSGTFEIIGENALATGKLHVRLQGQKLAGEWHLVRMNAGPDWLLIRGDDDMRDVTAKQDDTSVLSGKSMKQIGQVSSTSARRVTAPRMAKGKASTSPATKTEFIAPMMARLVDSIPSDNDWLYEVKFDGFRALAYKSAGHVRLLSRNKRDFTARFAEVAEALIRLPGSDWIIDGEIVALDKKGRSSFQRLQAHDLGKGSEPLFFYVFDLLRKNGRDLREKPLEVRKASLERLVRSAPSLIRFSPALSGPGPELLGHARRLGLEGLIGKRAGSVYESGRRSGAWIKLKLHHEQEMVIGGYTAPTGGRNHFGAVLVGHYEGARLVFAGKVGTGFTAASLQDLHGRFSRLEQKECPFVNLPETRRARYGQAMTAPALKRCYWLAPRLVCQVRFAEWTRDGKLRHPVFLGLREDKDAAEVIRESSP